MSILWGCHRRFPGENEEAFYETGVMRTILPIMVGNAAIPSKQNILFTNLQSIVNGAITKPQPDLYDGTRLLLRRSQVSRHARPVELPQR